MAIQRGKDSSSVLKKEDHINFAHLLHGNVSGFCNITDSYQITVASYKLVNSSI